MSQLTPKPTKRTTRAPGCLKNILLTFCALSGLFVVIVAINVLGGGSKDTPADSRIILVPTYTPTPGSPTPKPASTATRRPNPTPRPSPTSTTDYPTALMVAIGDLSPSMIAVTNMLDNPQYGDDQWVAAMRQELDMIDATPGRVAALVPPSQYREAHALFVSAVGRCQEASGHFRLAVDNGDQSQASIGVALLNSCTEQVKLAANLFKQAK